MRHWLLLCGSLLACPRLRGDWTIDSLSFLVVKKDGATPAPGDVFTDKATKWGAQHGESPESLSFPGAPGSGAAAEIPQGCVPELPSLYPQTQDGVCAVMSQTQRQGGGKGRSACSQAPVHRREPCCPSPTDPAPLPRLPLPRLSLPSTCPTRPHWRPVAASHPSHIQFGKKLKSANRC